MTANKSEFVPSLDMIGSEKFEHEMKHNISKIFPNGVNHTGIIFEGMININLTGDYHFLIEASPGGRI